MSDAHESPAIMASVSSPSAEHGFPLMKFPPEIVSNILNLSFLSRAFFPKAPSKPRTVKLRIRSRDLAAGLQLRLVSKYFDAEVTASIFRHHLLKDTQPWYSLVRAGSPLYYLSRSCSPCFPRPETSFLPFWHRYVVYQATTHPAADSRFMKLRQVSEKICAEVGTDFTETVERLCWISLECGAFKFASGSAASASGGGSEGAEARAELDLLSAAAYLGHITLAETLLQSGRLNPSQAADIFDSPMTLAAWGGHAHILRLFQEHQPEYRDRGLNAAGLRVVSRSAVRAGSRSFDWEGKVDPGAIVGAACRGDLELLQLAIYPPSRHNPETTSFLREPFGYVGASGAHECLVIAKEMTRDWKVYQFLAAFLGQYDKVTELDHIDAALKKSYMDTRPTYNFRRALNESRLQDSHRRREMRFHGDGMPQNGGQRERTVANPYPRWARSEQPEDPEPQPFVPCPYPTPPEVRKYDIRTGRNFLLRDLELAAEKGDIEIVRGLLNDGVGIPTDPPYDPLNLALANAREDVFDLLVERLSASSDPYAVIKDVTPKTNKGKCRMVRRIITCRIERTSPLQIKDWKAYVEAAVACDDSAVADFLFKPNVLAEFHVDSKTADEVRTPPHIAGLLRRT